MRWLVMPFLRYADFRGRSGRKEFWTFFGLSVAVIFLTVIATGLSADTSTVTQQKTPGANASPAGAISYLFWWLASIVPWFAVQVRRLHDQGRTGWLSLVSAGGYVAVGFGAMLPAALLFVIAMALMALPGEETENRFGPPIDAVEDYETATVDEDSPPADAGLIDVETAAPTFTENLTTPVAQSDVAEQQREMQAPDTLMMADADSFGSQYSARNAPTSSEDAMPIHVPDDVQSLDNGNYRCGGFIFYSREEAEWHSQRRALAMASIAAMPAISQTQSDGTALAFNEIEAGIHFGRDGNCYYRGNSFWTIEEARAAQFADLLARQEPDEASTSTATLPIENDERVANEASVGEMPAYLPADVKPVGNGRFSCGGYTFNSLEQALSFAKRRNDRVGHSERSVSPLSFVPVPKPPQPSPPNEKRSGFFGLAPV